jgi:redox-sensing transcriptional repressor
MARNKIISEAIIKRLPRYYRYLKELEASGESKVSSNALANLLKITASQVRQDFCTFGEFGMQGYGYDINRLRKEIGAILGLDKTYNVIIIGSGNIGMALCGYKGFKEEGFHIKAMFDIKDLTKPLPSGVEFFKMENLSSYVEKNHVDIAIITTQKENAYDVAKEIVALGIKAIWNFAPIDLKLGDDVAVENINMSESLFVLSYRMKNK